MDLFITKIKLKDTVKKEIIWNLVCDWLKGSQHYNITNIEYQDIEYFEQHFDSKKLSVVNTRFDTDDILAFRFDNSEGDNIWHTNIIFCENAEEKSLCIKLECESNDYSVLLPKIHRPHIIKLLFDRSLCFENGLIPISDKPVILNDSNLEVCSQIMGGKTNTDLPVVYVSYDTYAAGYDVDVKQLAIKLSGSAHVLVEPNKNFTYKIRELAMEKNPYNGYVGIYFPDTEYHEIVSYREFFKEGKLDKNAFENDIRYKVQRASVNHANIVDWTWDKLIVEFHKRRLLEESENAVKTRQELEDYIKAFDDENKQLNEKINELKSELDRKNAALEGYKRKHSSDHSISLNLGEIENFYTDEARDCVLSVLSYTLGRLGEDTRRYEIIKSINDSNKITGVGSQIFEKLEDALKEKSLIQRRKKLKDLGFEIEEDTHDTGYFHDKKYSFTLAGSPSDWRNSMNAMTDILRRIDIYKKF